MPLVRIEMLEGRSTEQKEALVRAMTEAMVNIANVPEEHIWVMIEEYKKENWAVGGVLISKKP